MHLLQFTGGLRQYVAGFISCISIMVLGSAIGWPAASIPKLLANDSPIPIDDSQIAWMVSLMYLANVISPIPTGHLMDRFGRKSTTLFLTIFPIISWIVLLYANKPYHLYIGRFLCGLSFGVVYTTIPIYLGEISEVNRRGKLGNLISSMTYAGALFIYSVGPYVSYRTLIYSCLLIPIIFFLTFIWMPESPHFLLMKGRREKAKKSLRWLLPYKNEEELTQELNMMIFDTEEQMKKSSKYVDLVSTSGNRKALIIVLFLAISQRLTGVGTLMAYSSITIPKNSIPGLNINACITILGAVWFLFSIVSAFLIERLGRKPLLCLSSAGCGVAAMTSTTWFYLNQHTDIDVSDYRWLPYVSFLFHALFYSLGMGSIGSSIKGELFPANIRGKGSAVTTIVLAMTSFILNKIYLLIADTYGMYLNFLIFSINCFITLLFIIFYVIETKGKTLQEIQDELNDVSNLYIDKSTTKA